jgi:4-amino-4-deoxy-L-arabinose transferase-like glycosyltransferase
VGDGDRVLEREAQESGPVRRQGILLFTLALALRLAVVVAAGPFTEPDSLTYDSLARNLVQGRGYLDTRAFKILDGSMSVPPVYPGFLAAVYGIFGCDYGPVIVIQQVLGALVVVMGALLAGRLFGVRIGLWSGVVLSVHPLLIVYGSTLMTEAVFTFLLMAAMLSLAIGLSGGGSRYSAVAGLFMGLAILCRASFQLYPPIVLLLIVATAKDVRRAVRHSVCFLVPVLLLLSAWSTKNYLTKGFFGLTSVGGANLLAGLDPPPASYDARDPVEAVLRDACGSATLPSIASLVPPSEHARMIYRSGTVFCTNQAAKVLLARGYPLFSVDREFRRIALRQIGRSPGRYLRRVAWHALTLWAGYQTEWLGPSFDKTLSQSLREGDYGVAATKMLFRPIAGGVVLVLTLVGVGLIVRSGRRLGWLPVSTFAYLTVLCAALNLGFVRYRMPLEPYIVMTCLYGLSVVAERISQRRLDGATLSGGAS